jgi:outer membrane biosynthesis protein TonB
MLEKISAVLRRKPLLGVGLSVVVHAALLMALLWVHPARTPTQKRGDTLIVELPNLQESGGQGTPGPSANEPLTPVVPVPKAAPARRAPPRPAAVAPPAPPREASRAVASAPQPLSSTERGDMPTTRAAPQPMTETAKPVPAKSQPAQPESPAAVAGVAPSPPSQIAMVPPSAPDIRSALRRGGGGGGTGFGGAGGTGIGRGGIVGEPVALDSKDTDLSDYLERIKRLIQQTWVYPCIKDEQTRVCEYKSTELVVEFGILRHGPVQYVEIRRASPYGIYDSFAVNAIKLASPFPPVPTAMMARMQQGSTGAAIVARFVYHIETGLTNVIR